MIASIKKVIKTVIFWDKILEIKKRRDDKVRYQNSMRSLKRIDNRNIPDNPDEIRLVMLVKDENLKLPYFFEYYRKLGVDRFFVIDNGSTDGTLEYLLAQEDTHVYEGTNGYLEHKVNWSVHIMREHCLNRWCIMADADEILTYPHYTKIDLHELARYLDKEGATALKSLWIAVYSDKSVKDSVYQRGEDFLKEFQYFDETCLTQGPNTRLFGWRTELDKTSFLKYTPGMVVDIGQHRIKGNVKLSGLYGAVLHFKFDSKVFDLVEDAVKRGHHYRGSAKYKKFLEGFTSNPELSLHYEGSIKFDGDKQLIDMGVMKTNEHYEKYVADLPNLAKAVD